MAKYCYPAVLTPDGEGYAVDFPDLPGCYTCGDSLEQALLMAEDVLALTLTDMEDDGEAIPNASDIRHVQAESEEIVTLVLADTVSYRKKTNNKAVKKTLTIPQWLNTAAEEKGVNFSQALQEALKKELQIV